MIVSDEKQGLKALRFCQQQEHSTPMRRLIELMPGKDLSQELYGIHVVVFIYN